MAPNIHGTGLALTGAYLDKETRKRIDDAVAKGLVENKADLVRKAVDMFLANADKETNPKNNGEEK